MGNNVRLGVKLLASLCFFFASVFETEVSLSWIFRKVLRIEKPCVVLKIIDQRTY